MGPLLAGVEPPTHFTRKSGGTPVAERIRSLVLDSEVEMDACKRADERT
jgi:thymidylate kinase